MAKIGQTLNELAPIFNENYSIILVGFNPIFDLA